MAMGRGRNHERHWKPKNHEWTRMDINGHEWLWQEVRNNEGHGKPRNHETHEIHEKTQNHEWIRMDTNGLNHEWTRMDTNDRGQGRG